MKPSGKRSRLHPLLLATALLAGPAAAFNLDSDTPIKVAADSARLDDSAGTAVYTGDVELTQGETRLEADRVVLYRNDQGVSRIEAAGSPAHYRQPGQEAEGMTDARALNITWSGDESLVIFEREAVIEQGGNIFRGDIIHYDTVRRVVTAEGGASPEGGSGRVEMVIQPRNSAQSSDGKGSDGSSESQ
ncbi:lipopolysaccharide transport periplasmic protein LptA [Marinobacter daepoensis]|uniref:Lipopolysaccharide export system protein LptA n=1 Tax=Marinobacter daepoensis TaxID=262077 RepID=A0ABS3BI83_9GAMM|nr:lipopolysaccharide transport periplasmic protein LptA [Marinobacter daepoensis]MBN7771202.1 lipopolysaccharide transport periplasmic protein LptA [Marinobacter daepoensis]MBY6079064.1 lipopolysaccharide transport periplasmic protein LptA [Marinobacter daepoensis]